MPMKPINASEEELMSNCDVQSANTEAGFAAVLAQQFTNLSMFNVVITADGGGVAPNC